MAFLTMGWVKLGQPFVGTAVGVAVGRLRTFLAHYFKLRGRQLSPPHFLRLLHPAGRLRVTVFGEFEHVYPAKHRLFLVLGAFG
jgi:hypothetical protein